jgi:hypothetical protein
MTPHEVETPEELSHLPWDEAIARLLEELSTVQGELLSLLDEKRRSLVETDLAAMAEMEPRETRLIERLEACQQNRSVLLARAEEEGLPSESIGAIAAALPETRGTTLRRQITDAQSRSRLLHHHSLTNWVIVQRTIIHLSQMLEIIATGGRGRPTYEKGKPAVVSGSLVDHAA